MCISLRQHAPFHPFWLSVQCSNGLLILLGHQRFAQQSTYPLPRHPLPDGLPRISTPSKKTKPQGFLRSWRTNLTLPTSSLFLRTYDKMDQCYPLYIFPIHAVWGKREGRKQREARAGRETFLVNVIPRQSQPSGDSQH